MCCTRLNFLQHTKTLYLGYERTWAAQSLRNAVGLAGHLGSSEPLPTRIEDTKGEDAMRSRAANSNPVLLPALLTFCAPLTGCLVAGYSRGSGFWVWPGSIVITLILILLFFFIRRRG